MRLLVILALFCLAASAGAQKIYINPSDQIHNWSPDKTYCEAEGMQDVARRLEAKLKARGFDVKNSDGATMRESCDAANAWPADVFISLHSNAAGSKNSGKAHGTNTLFFFPRDGREPNPISIKLAVICDEKVVEKMTTYGRGHDFAVTPDYPFLPYNLYVLRSTNMPGTLVEGLFHDNEEDVAVLKSDEGRDAYAQGVYEALCDHFGRSYYPDAPIIDSVGPVANDSEGNLALVVRGEKGNAEVIRQQGVNARWQEEWADLGGEIDGRPVIARNAQGRLHVFVQVAGGRVWHKVQASAGSDRWNGWYDLGGDAVGDPIVVRDADGRLAVFAVGSDGRLRSKVQRSTSSALQWGSWQDATEDDGLHGIRDAEGRMAVCRLDSKGQVLYRSHGESDWARLGGSFVAASVGISTDGRPEVFARDSEGSISHNSRAADGQWRGWQSLGGEFAGGPAVGRNRDGRIEVFARNKDGKWMYRIQREPGKSAIWDGWYTVGEYFKAKVREYKQTEGKIQ